MTSLDSCTAGGFAVTLAMTLALSVIAATAVGLIIH
jgi:hypothetical protein